MIMKKMRIIVQASLMCVCGWLLAGCGPVKSPAMNRYALTQSSTQVMQRLPSHKTILVTLPQSSPTLGGNDMLYVMKAYQLRAFAKNQWIASPAHMLQPLLVRSLRHSRYFRAVVMGPSAALTQYRIDTKLLTLQQEFHQRPSQIHIAWEVTLINNDTGKVIGTKTFFAKQKTTSDTPYGGVKAANQVSAELLKQTTRFIVRSLRKQG